VQLGGALIAIGAAVLVAIPSVYATVAASQPQHHHAWWWPTWWMLVPAGIVLVGVVLVAVERARPRADPRDWEARCDWGDDLFFVISHRRRNGMAVASFPDWRCAVTDPAGVQVEAMGSGVRVIDASVVAQFEPAFFAGAPWLKTGTYCYVWSAEDERGTWHEVAKGHCEAPYPPQELSTSDGATDELEVLVVEERFVNFQFRSLIVEARVRVHNRTDHPVEFGIGAEWQAIPEPGLTMEHPGQDGGVSAEIDRRQAQLGTTPRTVGPRATVHRWKVMATPNRPKGGTPWYELAAVTLGARHEYKTRRLEEHA
jgi:hypothetical protein